jgi:hypothetical protein
MRFCFMSIRGYAPHLAEKAGRGIPDDLTMAQVSQLIAEPRQLTVRGTD